MSRIHPSDQSRCHGHLLFRNHKGGRKRPLHDDDDDKHRDQVAASSVMLTVWKRSSMSFQGTDGFTVFDPHGTLVFRVDNYSRKNGYGLVVLMDGVGNALLSLKPKILSMQYQWRAYRGDQDGCEKANVFFMRSPSVLSNFQAAGRKHVAEIFMGTHSGGHHQSMPDLKIEGSFRSRDCKIVKTCTGEVVARISRKRVMNNTTVLLSDDVFSLVVHPGFDTHLIMAFVIVLDRISSKPFSPFLCS